MEREKKMSDLSGRQHGGSDNEILHKSKKQKQNSRQCILESLGSDSSGFETNDNAPWLFGEDEQVFYEQEGVNDYLDDASNIPIEDITSLVELRLSNLRFKLSSCKPNIPRGPNSFIYSLLDHLSQDILYSQLSTFSKNIHIMEKAKIIRRKVTRTLDVLLNENILQWADMNTHLTPEMWKQQTNCLRPVVPKFFWYCTILIR